MRLVVADTTPLNYLVLIGQVEILPALFERIFVPQTVQNELRQNEAPESVRRWIAAPPSWLEIVPTEQVNGDPELLRLDEGERAAIVLATQIGADLLLIDDRDGVNVARSRGFAVTGTLGILDVRHSRHLFVPRSGNQPQERLGNVRRYDCRECMMSDRFSRTEAQSQ